MTHAKLLAYCLSKAATRHDFQPEWDAHRVWIADKMFMLMGVLNGRPIVLLKCNPDRADQLRQAFKDITPGYHMNKTHWNTLYLDGELPPELVYGCIDESYQLVTHGLPKKTQKLLGMTPA